MRFTVPRKRSVRPVPATGLARCSTSLLGLSGRTIAVDTEATGLICHGPWRSVHYNFGTEKKPDREIRKVCPARPFAFSFADMDANTWYAQYEVDPMTREVIYDPKWDSYKRMQDVLEDDRITKWLHNPRYDLLQYQFIGIHVKGPVFDTQILSHIATCGQEFSYMLKPLCKKWLEFDDGDEKDLRKIVHRYRHEAKIHRHAFGTEDTAGKDPWKADMWMLRGTDRNLVKTYAVNDVIRVILLVHLWHDEVQADPDMKGLFDREHELMWALKDMEDVGTRVFPKDLTRLKKFYLGYQAKQKKIIDANGGAGLNYASTKQMAEVFYEQRGHPPVHTQTWNPKLNRCNYSLNGEQLVKMANGYTYEERTLKSVWYPAKQRFLLKSFHVAKVVPPDPLAKAILEWKAAGQTIGTFLEVYERYMVEDEPGVWVLHPGYKQTGTITGRLSCSDPNLMQVASETTGRRKADIQSRPREAFGPRPGCYWYLPDYSQIEVWLFAFLSGEEAMQEVLLAGEHFHTQIAIKVFGKKADFKQHKDYYVKCAKLIMFAKLYGGGLAKLASLLKMATADAKLFIEEYEAELPGVGRFMKSMINRALRDGEIRNPFGRRYTFESDFAYRAVNYMIQGSAADVMKNAVTRVHRILKNKWPGVHLLLTIHDELIIEVPAEYHSQELMRDIVKAMQGDTKVLNLPVPLPVEMKVVKPDGRWNKTIKFKKEINDAIGAYTKAA
jgi:DNA polymerase-1